MRLLKRVAEVYQQGGLKGIASQTGVKLAYWHRWASFRPHVIEKSLAGHTFKVAINNQFAQGWIEERKRWPELEWVAANLLEEGDFVVDCGANIGFTSIFFARCAGPTCRVIGFEPLPSNVADARQNIELNGLANVEIRNQAVGSTNGTASLSAVPNGILTTERNGNVIEVPIVRLDDAIPGDPPTLLKIDVEGFELEVLQGAPRILASRPKLDIEVHPIFRPNPIEHTRAIFAELQALDYELFVQSQVDGMIEPLTVSPSVIDDLATTPVFHIFAYSK